LFRIGDESGGSQIDLLHVIGEADDCDDDITGWGEAGGGVVPGRAGVDERLGFGLCAVEDVELISCGEEMTSHGAAHHACADEADNSI